MDLTHREAFLPEDFLQRQVRPENHLVWHIHVQSQCTFQLWDHTDVLTPVHCHHSHLMFVGEVQRGYGAWRTEARRVSEEFRRDFMSQEVTGSVMFLFLLSKY